MSSIEIKSAIKIQLAEILDGASHLDTPDLERFLEEFATLVAKRKVKTLPKREAELLLGINQKLLSSKLQEKYNQLYKKLQDEDISVEEHKALMKLIKKREEKGVERLKMLVELAQIREVSLKNLMQQLGIHSLADAA